MFQIKQILISDKDSPTKYRMQFRNDEFIYKGSQTYLDLCEKNW